MLGNNNNKKKLNIKKLKYKKLKIKINEIIDILYYLLEYVKYMKNKSQMYNIKFLSSKI